MSKEDQVVPKPLEQFKSFEEAQQFVIAIRTLAMRSCPKDDLKLASKIYAIFDAASFGLYVEQATEAENG
jgi:hypothetical protein